MVRIELDGRLLNVTRGAYNSMYAPNGWKIVGEKKTVKEKEDVEDETVEEVEKDAWEDVEDETVEVDLDSMGSKALKRLAKEKGLNPDDYKTLGEMRKALKPLV